MILDYFSPPINANTRKIMILWNQNFKIKLVRIFLLSLYKSFWQLTLKTASKKKKCNVFKIFHSVYEKKYAFLCALTFYEINNQRNYNAFVIWNYFLNFSWICYLESWRLGQIGWVVYSNECRWNHSFLHSSFHRKC